MAPKKNTGLAVEHGIDQAAKAPNPSLRRSKRLQDQSWKSKATLPKVESGVVAAKKLPANVAKKGRKINKVTNTVGKKGPVQQAPKSQPCKESSERNPGSAKLPEQDGDNNATSNDRQASPKPTLNKQPAQAAANKSQGNPASKTATSPRSPNEDKGGQHGVSSPSPKRKLVQEGFQDASNTERLPKSPKPSPNSYNRSGNLRICRRLEEFASAGWQITEDLPEGVCCADTVDLSRIPSPLADLGNQQERFLHFIDNHVPDQVRLLFREMLHDSTYYKREITRAFMERAQGVFVEYMSGTRPTPAGASDQRDKDVEMFGDVESFLHSWSSDTPSLVAELGPYGEGILLKTCAFENPKLRQRGQFVLNGDYHHLVINESVFGQDLIAGPLPEFAVIQIGQHTLFWWRTLRALDYVPHKDALIHGPLFRLSAPVRQDLQGLTEIRHKEQSNNSNENWDDILDQGLARSRKRGHNYKRPSKGQEPHQIDRCWDLEFDSVLLAIASVWQALSRAGICYAFAGMDVFDPNLVALNQITGPGVVAGPKKFIMPLFLQPGLPSEMAALGHYKKKTQSKDGATGPAVGHIVLAVAEKLAEGANGVTIDIRDSRRGTCPHTLLEQKAAILALQSGWLGHRHLGRDLLPLSIWPKERVPKLQHQTVPQQPEGSNACGLFTILNAWAVMLEIPLRTSLRRRGDRSNEEFFLVGQELVNLALSGVMDSRTIQAFLNVFGLSRRQDTANLDDEVKFRVQSVSMNEARFGHALNIQKWREKGVKMPSLSPGAAGGTDQALRFPEEDIQYLLDRLGTTRERALRALCQTDGDVANAEAIIQAETQSPEPLGTE